MDRDGEHWIDTLLVGNVPPGTWLLQHLGIAREVIDRERAFAIAAALDSLEAAATGVTDFDAYFADLVGREPQLPEHLRPQRNDSTP